jgi:3-deoxy-7-phosphoheptulonate synthase
MELTDNLNIKQFKPLPTPGQVKDDYPLSGETAHLVNVTRKALQDILNKTDRRLMVIVGPCSLHDRDATLEYADRLKALADSTTVRDKLLIIMRAYFEKPRTTIGWKGMLYDPHLDGSYDIENGIRSSRQLMLEINQKSLPTATEFLDPIVPQYLADLVSWAAIGARTTESQIHRQMASGLSMPIGFKNSTDGNLSVAVDAIKAAGSSHSFMGIDRNGKVIIAETRGNRFGHLVLRGGSMEPNFGSEYVAFAEEKLRKAGIFTGMVIDCSHANSCKDHKRQGEALYDIANQIRAGNTSIRGLMIESFLSEGNQKVTSADSIKFGQSVTDACIGWEETEKLIKQLAANI